jgi:hypothetical protein
VGPSIARLRCTVRVKVLIPPVPPSISPTLKEMPPNPTTRGYVNTSVEATVRVEDAVRVEDDIRNKGGDRLDIPV